MEFTEEVDLPTELRDRLKNCYMKMRISFLKEKREHLRSMMKKAHVAQLKIARVGPWNNSMLPSATEWSATLSTQYPETRLLNMALLKNTEEGNDESQEKS